MGDAVGRVARRRKAVRWWAVCQPESPPRGRRYSALSEAGEAQAGDCGWQSRPLESAGMPVTKAGRASSGQKRTSSAGHGLWQRTRRAVSGGLSAVCSSRARLAA